MKKLFPICICCLLCCLLGCSPRKQHSQESISLLFDTIHIDTVCHLLKETDLPKCEFKLEMVYPVFTSDEDVLATVQQFVVNSYFREAYSTLNPLEAAEAYCNHYLESYRKVGEEALADDYGNDISSATPWLNYAESSKGIVVFNERNVFSYKVFFDTYRGGAHGEQSCSCHVLDLESSCRVYLVDLFKEGVIPQVSTLLRQSMAEQYGCKSVADLSEKLSVFSPEEIEITDNFYVTDKGITWVFNPSVIAPYSSGIIEASISWDQLAKYVDVNSLLYRFVNPNE